MWPRWLTEALRGKASLSRAFWLYGLGVSVAYSIPGLFIDLGHLTAAVIYLLVGLAIGVVQTTILWRSSYNSRSRLLGRLVRMTMILGLVFVVFMIWLLYSNRGLLGDL